MNHCQTIFYSVLYSLRKQTLTRNSICSGKNSSMEGTGKVSTSGLILFESVVSAGFTSCAGFVTFPEYLDILLCLGQGGWLGWLGSQRGKVIMHLAFLMTNQSHAFYVVTEHAFEKYQEIKKSCHIMLEKKHYYSFKIFLCF